MASLFTTITAESPGASPYEFDSVTTESGNSFEPSTDVAHSGSYSYKCSFGGSNDAAFGDISFVSSSNEVYIDLWVYIDSEFSFQWGDNNGRIAVLTEDRTGNTLVEILLYSTTSSTPDRWRVQGVDITQTDSATNFSLNTWHHIEIYWQAGASENGIARVWIDDDLIFEDTALTSNYNATRLRAGYLGSVPASGSLLYYDDISGEDEIPAGGTAHQATIQDSVGITDSLTRIGRFIRSITDALGITDSIASDSSNRTYPSYITAEVVLVSQYTAEIINEAAYTAEIINEAAYTAEIIKQ